MLSTARANNYNLSPNTKTGSDGYIAGDYAIGATGPGGGKIIYRDPAGFTIQGYGNPGDSGYFASYTAYYIEVAPAGWHSSVPTGDPTLAWASSAFVHPDNGGTGDWVSISGLSSNIGTGRRNTALILATDGLAPAALACRNYTGGGQNDWYLPNMNEIIEVATQGSYLTGLTMNTHRWSSSQFSAMHVNALYYDGPHAYTSGNFMLDNKSVTYPVRPIRVF